MPFFLLVLVYTWLFIFKEYNKFANHLQKGEIMEKNYNTKTKEYILNGIRVMKKYGAVNAANLDGGSSSSMYYNGNYEMSSVTFYYANSSWKLPTGFVIKGKL